MNAKNQVKYWVLPNGLRLVVQPIKSSRVVICNTMYHVGSCNENPNQTGIAHLLEHIMCAGSTHIDSYDELLQKSGGTNNAYTSFDVTSYWSKLPATKLDIGIWIESERMFHPKFAKNTIDVQRKVVIEEFKQVCLSKPYGDLWHTLLPFAYQKHPYRTPIIGKETAHISNISSDDIIKFHSQHYHPQNAILCIVGGIDPEEAYSLVKKSFASMPKKQFKKIPLPQEPAQKNLRRGSIKGHVPQDLIHMAYKMGARKDHSFLVAEILANILAEGDSSWFPSELIQKKKVFNSIQAYTLDTIEPGLFVITGKPAQGVSLEDAEKYLKDSWQKLLAKGITEEEVTKACNQFESDFRFSQIQIIEQINHLAWATLLGDPNFLEKEIERLKDITPKLVTKVAEAILKDSNANILYYRKNDQKQAIS